MNNLDNSASKDSSTLPNGFLKQFFFQWKLQHKHWAALQNLSTLVNLGSASR